MQIETPVPATFEELLWLGIGLTFARAFAESDYALQETEWFKNLSSGLARWIVKAFMDFFHHWWMGGLLIVYSIEIANLAAFRVGVALTPTIVYWVGWGILLDDIPDLPSRLKKYFGYAFR